MFLGYYKHIFKQKISGFFFLFSLRRKGIIVNAGCKISKSAQIAKGVVIRENSIIGEGSIIGENVLIGSNTKLSNIKIEKNTAIESGVIITGCGNGKIEIGKESYIGIYDVLDWSDNITIGNYVHIAGPSTGLWTHSSALQCHNGLPLSYKDKEFRPTAPIIIEDYVYIGGNCTIYPGVTIGHHSMIAPNSAVTKDVEPYTLVGGVPAKVIKKINDR